MKDSLHIIYGDVAVGSLVYDRKKDEITLTYEQSWQFGAGSFPISLSLPLARKSHPDAAIRPFLQNLLPDNPAVIEAWGKRFHVSPRNPFDVIKHVGEDCAGALQFVRPERLERILSGELDALVPVSEEDLESRMEALKSQSRAVPVEIAGRFSLAGAQNKDALCLKDGKWFVPGGRIPSTHILKPEISEFEHHALNEHFCLNLAIACGLPAASSFIAAIGKGRVLCVKRYDRHQALTGEILRIHQEDTCQALGRTPGMKYQSDGGPSAAEIVGLLGRFSDDFADDMARFTMALAFNWIIVGTDAHSKNFSLMHARGTAMRLAPLYDLASWLPYERDPNSPKIKLAMKIGGSYRLHQIIGKHWRKWADEAELSGDGVMELVGMTVGRVLKSLPLLRDSMLKYHDHPFVEHLTGHIMDRAKKCEELLR